MPRIPWNEGTAVVMLSRLLDRANNGLVLPTPKRDYILSRNILLDGYEARPDLLDGDEHGVSAGLVRRRGACPLRGTLVIDTPDEKGVSVSYRLTHPWVKDDRSWRVQGGMSFRQPPSASE